MQRRIYQYILLIVIMHIINIKICGSIQLGIKSVYEGSWFMHPNILD